MDHRRHIHVSIASAARFDMRNQPGLIFITRLGQMDRCHPPTTCSACARKWPLYRRESRSSSAVEEYCHWHGSGVGLRRFQIVAPRLAATSLRPQCVGASSDLESCKLHQVRHSHLHLSFRRGPCAWLALLAANTLQHDAHGVHTTRPGQRSVTTLVQLPLGKAALATRAVS